MAYEKYTKDEIFEILSPQNGEFELKMNFIPFYNKASIEDKSWFNNLLITRMLRIGKKTELLEEVIRREIGVTVQKILIKHC